MAFAPNNPPVYVDGDFTVATAISKPRLSQPFQGDSGEYVLQQDFMQAVDSFVALGFNTAYTTAPYTDYVLVGESPLANHDAGIVSWTRTYAKVPAQRSDPSSYSYRFIGYETQIVVDSGDPTKSFRYIGRPRFTREVASRIQHDYFLIGTGGLATQNLIPLLLEQAYYIPLGFQQFGPGTINTFTPTYPITNALQQLTGNQVDFITDTVTFAGNAFVNSAGTIPSRTDYLAMVTAKSEIIAAGSKLTRWMGNIIDRATTYIVAQ